MQNSEKLAEMRTFAREFVLANSWDAVFEKVYEAYQKTLDTAQMTANKRQVVNKIYEETQEFGT